MGYKLTSVLFLFFDKKGWNGKYGPVELLKVVIATRHYVSLYDFRVKMLVREPTEVLEIF